MNQQEFLKFFPNSLIQSMDDVIENGKKRCNASLAQIFSYDKLRIADLQDDGAAICFCINPTTEGKRTISNLKEISALGLDLDVCKENELTIEKAQEKKEKMHQALKNFENPPNFIIETKNGLQPIWIFDPFREYSTTDEANKLYLSVVKGLCDKISHKSEGDSVIRTLRLPGTLHQKNLKQPFEINIIYENVSNPWYDFKQFIEKYSKPVSLDKPLAADKVLKTPKQEYDSDILVNKSLKQQILELPLADVIVKSAAVKNITVTFRENSDGSRQIIEDGGHTSGFISSRGEFCHSSSGKERKGNQIKVAEYYLKCTYNEALEWFKQTFNLNDSNERTVKLISIGELYACEDQPIRWTIEKLIPENGITICSGSPGLGKSWAILDFARAIASGGLVFGKFQAAQGPVLMIDEENSKSELKRRLKMLNADKNLPIHFLVRHGLKIDNPKDFAAIVKVVNKTGAKTIFFDSLIRVHSGEENDAGAMAKVFERISALLRLGCTIILTHHHRKPNGYLPSQLGNSLRGSSDILAAVDSHLSLDRKDDIITVHQTKLRQGVEIKPFEIKMTEVDEKINIEFVRESQPNKVKMEEAKEAISHLLEEGKAMETKEIINAFGEVGEKNIRIALKELVKEKIILKSQQGHNKFLYSKKSGTDEQTFIS